MRWSIARVFPPTLVARGGGTYGQTARTDRWRYIKWSDGSPELDDERNDPQEVTVCAQELFEHAMKIERAAAGLRHGRAPMRSIAFALGVGVVMLAGCAVGPNYSRPAVTTPTTWKEIRPRPKP